MIVCTKCGKPLEVTQIVGGAIHTHPCACRCMIDNFEAAMKRHNTKKLKELQEAATLARVAAARAKAESRTAWRIEGTLREFAPFKPMHVWFDYPVHKADTSGVLGDLAADGELPPWQKAISKRKSKGTKSSERKATLRAAYEACTIEGKVTLEALAEYMDCTEKTVRNRVKEAGNFDISDGYVNRKEGK